MLRKSAFRKVLAVLIAAGPFVLSEPAVSGTPVALELVLAADASSSVDDKEYALQVSGYVNAFRDPDVVAAIEALGPSGIAAIAGHRSGNGCTLAPRWTTVAR